MLILHQGKVKRCEGSAENVPRAASCKIDRKNCEVTENGQRFCWREASKKARWLPVLINPTLSASWIEAALFEATT